MLNSQTEPVLGSPSETSQASQKKPKVNLVCQNCGSDNIVADAYARWDIQTQNWNLSFVFDNKICEDCGYEKDYCGEVPIEKKDEKMKPEDRINELLAANNLLVENNRLLKQQLRRDRDQFAFYSKEHRAKTTATRPIPMSLEEINSTLRKATVNEGFVVEITTVLDATSPR